MEEILELVDEIGISIVDIANYPDNEEHLDYAQSQLIELKNKLRKILLV